VRYLAMLMVPASGLSVLACSLALDLDSVRQCQSSDECQYEAGLGTCVANKCVSPDIADSNTDSSMTALDSNDGTDQTDSVTVGDPSGPSSTFTGPDTESGGDESNSASDPTEGGNDDDSADTEAQMTGCPSPAIAGTDALLLIDDMEPVEGSTIADASLPQVDGRRGQWYTSNDGSGIQMPSPFVPSLGGANGTNYSARTSVQSFTGWGASFGVPLNARSTTSNMNCPYDATAFDGIHFWARGSGSWTFAVATQDTVPIATGGRCDAVCNDGFQTVLIVSDTWTYFEFPWEILRQGGWGMAAEWNASELMLLQWNAPVATTDDVFILEVDEIGFVFEPEGSETGEASTGG